MPIVLSVEDGPVRYEVRIWASPAVGPRLEAAFDWPTEGELPELCSRLASNRAIGAKRPSETSDRPEPKMAPLEPRPVSRPQPARDSAAQRAVFPTILTQRQERTIASARLLTRGDDRGSLPQGDEALRVAYIAS